MADFDSGRVWAAWASPGYKGDAEAIKVIRAKCAEWFDKGLVATDRIGGWPGGFEHADLGTSMDHRVGMVRLSIPKYREAFERAQAVAANEASKGRGVENPQVDPYLHMAGLKNRSCGMILQVATGEYIFPPKGQGGYSSEGYKGLWEKYGIDYIAIHYALARTYLFWDAAKVKECAAKADWKAAEATLKQQKASMAILYSARQFLDTCAAMNLCIRFAAQ